MKRKGRQKKKQQQQTASVQFYAGRLRGSPGSENKILFSKWRLCLHAQMRFPHRIVVVKLEAEENNWYKKSRPTHGKVADLTRKLFSVTV